MNDETNTSITNGIANVRFVLVGTTHPGNIGGVARAMKTMALSQLVLVSPRHFPDPTATAMATGAADILENARVCDTLADAVGDCELVIGTSARQRYIRWPFVSPGEAAHIAHTTAGTVAFVFGRESSGLTNGELDLCHKLLHIPCAESLRSLNLASAAQVVAYELYKHTQDEPQAEEAYGEDRPAQAKETEALYTHLENVLRDGDFFKGKNSEPIMRRWRRLFGRAAVTRREVGLMRGLLTLFGRER